MPSTARFSHASPKSNRMRSDHPAPAAGSFGQFAALRRHHRGRSAYFSGLAAEETVIRRYRANGYRLLERRWRCAEGEIDLIAERDGLIVFVEVKSGRLAGGSPVSNRQWRRLEQAALRYMMLAQERGASGYCRFDVALVDRTGDTVVHENAHLFEQD